MQSLWKKKVPQKQPGEVAGEEKGFTLIETSIAMVVMLVAALAAVNLFSYAVNYNSGAYDRTLAVAIVQQRMEQLRKGSFDEIVSSSDQDVVSGGRHFSVTTDVTGTTLKTITVTVTPLGAGTSWSRNSVVIISQRSATGIGTYF